MRTEKQIREAVEILEAIPDEVKEGHEDDQIRILRWVLGDADWNTERLKVGDRIEFNYFGQMKRGTIETVGDHGYWMPNDSTPNGSIRCSFGKATKI